jgi:hypothetical protein
MYVLGDALRAVVHINPNGKTSRNTAARSTNKQPSPARGFNSTTTLWAAWQLFFHDLLLGLFYFRDALFLGLFYSRESAGQVLGFKLAMAAGITACRHVYYGK